MELVDRLETWSRFRAAYAIFCLTAAVLFADFFVQGHVLVGSNDHVFTHYPNLLFGHRALRQGDFGLWNPLIFAGVDFTTSFHHHLLHPRNWPLALVPEAWLFNAVTLQLYVEFALIGCLALGIFRRYTATGVGAMSLALVTQLGGFAWFTATTLIGTHLLFSATAAIYLLVTMADRRSIVNFLLLSLCFFDILAMGHVAYIIAFGLPVIAVFAWHGFENPCPRTSGLRSTGFQLVRFGQVGNLPYGLWTVAAAFALALVSALYRIVPVLHGLIYEQTAVGAAGLDSFQNHGYFALTALVPEALGLYAGDSVSMSRMLGIEGRHIQFHSLVYFGIVPGLLLWIAFLRGVSPRALVIGAVALAVAAVPTYLVQPLSDVVCLVLHPLHHEIIIRSVSTFLFLVAMCLCVRHVEEHGLDIHESRVRSFLAVVAFFVVCGLALWIKIVQPWRDQLGANWFRLILVLKASIILIAATAGWLAFRARWTPALARRTTNVALLIFALAGSGALAAAVWKGQLLGSWLTLRGIAYAAAGGLGIAAVVVATRSICSDRTSTRGHAACAALLLLVFIVLCIVPLPEGSGKRTWTIALSSGLSMARCLLLGAAALEIVTLCGRGTQHRAALLPLLALLTLVDLVAFNKLYAHVGTAPFMELGKLFPRDRDIFDPAARTDWSLAKASPNLLRNPALAGEGAPREWQLAGATAQPGDAPGELTLVNSSSDASRGLKPTLRPRVVRASARTSVASAELSQDQTLPAPGATVTLGAWVRCDAAGAATVEISGGAARSTSRAHSGSGQWEWLTATFRGSTDVANVRAKVVLAGAGRMSLTAPQLINGGSVLPATMPNGRLSHRESDSSRSVDFSPHERRDVRAKARTTSTALLHAAEYRVNHPMLFCLFQPHEQPGNVSMIHGLRTYAGVDSDVKRSLHTLMSAFDSLAPQAGVAWSVRGGVVGVVEHPKLLDLLGVKYDCAGIDIVERPHALPRLALFRQYEMTGDAAQFRSRVVADSFDHTTTLLLDADPPIVPAGGLRDSGDASAPAVDIRANDPDRFEAVPFREESTSRLTARVQLDEPRLLLFNDGYSPWWRCRSNGRELPVQRANGHFMAVALPPGEHDLSWEFSPTPVVLLAKLSLFCGAVWMAIAAASCLPRRRAAICGVAEPRVATRRAA